MKIYIIIDLVTMTKWATCDDANIDRIIAYFDKNIKGSDDFTICTVENGKEISRDILKDFKNKL